jgi:hypothetical protein
VHDHRKLSASHRHVHAGRQARIHT